jgi:HEAT repeat protein
MMSHLRLSLLLLVTAAMTFGLALRLPAQSGPQGSHSLVEEAFVFVQALSDEDERVRSAAADGLRDIGVEAIPALRQGLNHWNPHVYEAAAVVLSGIGEPAMPVLIEGLTNHNLLVRLAAANAMRRMGAKAIPALCGTLEAGVLTDVPDANAGSGQSAVTGVAGCQSGSQQDYRALVADHQQADLRREAASALGNIAEDIHGGAAAAIPVLVEALDDPHDYVRSAAAKALQTIGEATIPAVRDVLKTGNASARYAATTVLSSFGAQFADLAPALAEAANDKDARVRIAALEALWVVNIPLVRTEASQALDGTYNSAVTEKIDAVAQILVNDSRTAVAMLRQPIGGSNKRARILAVIVTRRFALVAAAAERRAAKADLDAVAKEAAQTFAAEATKGDSTFSNEKRDALAASAEGPLREAVQKAVQEALAVNGSVREAAERALHAAAADPDTVVSVAATRALRKLAAQ